MTDFVPGGFNVGGDNWPQTPKFQEFAGFLGLHSSRDAKGSSWLYDDKTSKRVKDIYHWGMKVVQEDDISKIKEWTVHVRRQIGTNVKGKELVDNVWKYLRMRDEGERVQREIRLMEMDGEEAPAPVAAEGGQHE